MKTAGSLLRDKRLLKELSLEEVSRAIKVKVEYLRALEESDYASLPSVTTTKGFLRNYARFLHLNPDTLVALFRRDFNINRQGLILPRGLVSPLSPRPRSLSVNSLLSLLTLAVFFAFLGYQLFLWWRLPSLHLFQPVEGEVYSERLTVRGKTDPDVSVRINSQLVLTDSQGQFSLDLVFPAGTHSVIVEAVSRQGKSRLLERTFTVSK